MLCVVDPVGIEIEEHLEVWISDCVVINNLECQTREASSEIGFKQFTVGVLAAVLLWWMVWCDDNSAVHSVLN